MLDYDFEGTTAFDDAYSTLNEERVAVETFR
jgi:hypothetical protein